MAMAMQRMTMTGRRALLNPGEAKDLALWCAFNHVGKNLPKFFSLSFVFT